MADVTISTLQNLIDFGNGVYGYGSSSSFLSVELTADLDFADLAVNNTPYDWAGCVGTYYVHFDGKGHTIKNISHVGTGNWGFIDVLNGSIKNLNLTDLYVVGACVGGIASYLNGSTILNCKVSGQIEGIANTSIGGIAGNGSSTITFRSCSFFGKILHRGSGNIANIGGIIGRDGGCYLYNCMVVADLEGNNYTMGLAGDGNTLINCEFRGSLKAANGRAAALMGTGGTCINGIAVVTSVVGAWYSSISGINNWMDSTLAAAGGFSIQGGFGAAATTDLQNATWLFNHGFAVPTV